MNINKHKKIFSFGIVLTLIVLAILPNITANEINFQEQNTKTVNNQRIAYNSEDNNTIYDLLIITPAKFKDLLEPLETHKEKLGVKTYIVTLDEIYDQIYWQGRDKPEKIKYFIKTALDEWGIKYVLLVGDFRKIPIRYVYNDEPWEGFPEPYFISELYYADIYDKNSSFSSWDTNNNGIFGEWKGNEAQDKNIDLYPDVYVGRIACRNNFEVKIMVNKIINYETNTYDSEWFNRIVVVAGDTYPNGQYPFPTPEYEGEENAKTVLSYMPGLENTSLFTSDDTLTGPKDVIKAIDQGCGFLFFEGHGAPIIWSTHPPNETTWIDGLTIASMSRLKNKNMLPVCVVGGCHNSQFDVNLLNLIRNFKEATYYSIWAPECWSWKLTRKIGGGSIATIGNSGLGMSKEDKTSLEGAGDFIDTQLFYEYGVNGTDILGECWGKAISNYLDKYPINWNTKAGWDYAYDAKTVQQWVLIGDPSLKIGGYPPQGK